PRATPGARATAPPRRHRPRRSPCIIHPQRLYSLMIAPSTCRFEDGCSPFERLLNHGLEAKRRLEEAGCFDTSAFHAMVEEAVEIIESEDEDAKGCKKRATLGQRSSADI